MEKPSATTTTEAANAHRLRAPTPTALCGATSRDPGGRRRDDDDGPAPPQRPICSVRARAYAARTTRSTYAGPVFEPGRREGCCHVVAFPEAQRLRRAIIIDQWERRQLRPVRAVEQLVHDVRARRGDEYESFQHFCSMLPMGAAHAGAASLICLQALRGFWGGTCRLGMRSKHNGSENTNFSCGSHTSSCLTIAKPTSAAVVSKLIVANFVIATLVIVWKTLIERLIVCTIYQ